MSTLRDLLRPWLALLAVALFALGASAQAPIPATAPVTTAVYGPPAPPLPLVGELSDELTRVGEDTIDEARMSTAVEIAVLLTVLSLLPAILITITSFTRIVIVMSFVRRALSTNELPPNPVIIGLALFLTTFIMAPVAERAYERAWVPYQAGEIGMKPAGEAAWAELRGFLVVNTRQSELELFADLAKLPDAERDIAALPLRVVVPAFVTSELKTAFQMGFLLFLPFLVIDLVIASVLLSMGMFMLPPVMISTPFKILIFVLVDGWHLLCESLVSSFIVN
ncbi:MAG: flagellar type III secretion system pore protein FliP [Planctomycetes bacterium]|nr:flagellar type III secretion system pore protein FliP [Planctomycetota bacterium]